MRISHASLHSTLLSKTIEKIRLQKCALSLILKTNKKVRNNLTSMQIYNMLSISVLIIANLLAASSALELSADNQVLVRNRLLEGNWDVVNSKLLNPLALELDIASIELPIVIDDATCYLGGTPGNETQACVDLDVYFKAPFIATCSGITVGDVKVNLEYFGTEKVPNRKCRNERGEYDPTFYPEYELICGSSWPTGAIPDMDAAPDEIMQRYKFEVSVIDMTVFCEVPLIVTNNVDSQGPTEKEINNLAEYGGSNKFANLTMDASKLNLKLTSYLYSEDFSRFPPQFGRSTDLDCGEQVDFEQVLLFGYDLGFVEAPIVGKIEITEPMNEKLNGPKQSIAMDPIKEIFCEMLTNASNSISDLFVNNTLTQESVYFNQDTEQLDSFSALKLENETKLLTDNLVDLGDNAVMDLIGLFPGNSLYLAGEDEGKSSIVDSLYDFLGANSSNVDGPDGFLYLLDYFLNTTLAETNGKVTQLNLLEVAETVVGNETIDASQGLEFSFNVSLIEGKPAAVVNITLLNVYVTTFPEGNSTRGVRSFLEQVRLIGGQTIKIPRIELGDLYFELDLKLDFEFYGGAFLVEDIDNLDGSMDMILSEFLAFELHQEMGFNLLWEQFLLDTAVFVALSEDSIRNLPLGPLWDDLTDCLLSTFYVEPSIAAFVVNANSMDVNFTGLDPSASGSTDAIIYTLATLLDSIVEIYNGAIPGLIEKLVGDNFVNQPLIDARTCPQVEISENSTEFFSFQGSLMDEIRNFLDEGMISTVFGILFPKPDAEELEGTRKSADYNQLISEPIELLKIDNIPVGGDRNSTLEFKITTIELKGLDPANFTLFDFLIVNSSGIHGNESIFNDLRIGIPSNPLIVAIEFDLNQIPDIDFQVNGTARRLQGNTPNPTYSFSERLPTKSPTTPTQAPSPYASDAPTLYPSVGSQSFAPTSFPSRPPTKPKALQIEGTQYNTMRIEIQIGNLQLLLDMWLRYLKFDVESTTIEETLDLNCWVGKLKPYGGLYEIAVVLKDSIMKIDCIECESNEILQGMAYQFSNRNPEFQTASTDFFDLVNNLLDKISQVIMNQFKEENWDHVVGNFERQCQHLEPLEVEYNYTVIVEDLTPAMGYLGIAVLFLMVTGFLSCCCVRGTHHTHEDFDFDDKQALMMGVEGPALNQALFNHSTVPLPCRFIVPFLLLANLLLFIIGHVGVALTTDIIAVIGGMRIALEQFAAISVISSTISLWESGGYFLAILLILVSIAWPYIKIIGMLICWFSPTSVLSFDGRGAFISKLDQFGKWSLVELFFVIFVLVTFALSMESPKTSYLVEDFYVIDLVLNPQLSLYTFCTALVVSLFLSNVIEYYHEKIEENDFHFQRGVKPEDEEKISMMHYVFESYSKSTVKLGFGGVVFVLGTIAVSIVLMVVAGMLPVFNTNIIGLVALVYDFSDQDTNTDYSLFTFVDIVFSNGTFGAAYLGFVFLLTVLILPVLQLILSGYLLVTKFTLDEALFWYMVNHFLSSWCCLEVFIFAIGLTALEVRQISGYLAAAQCEFLKPIMQAYLLPLDIVNEVDIQASCFAIECNLQMGAYVTFAAVVISNIAHFAVQISFNRMIIGRLGSAHTPKGNKVAAAFERFLIFTGVLKEQQGAVAVADNITF